MNISRLTIQKMIAVTAMAMALPMSAHAAPHAEGDKKPHSEMRQHHRHGGDMAVLKKLDLTEAQQTQVKQIKQKQRADMKDSMSERRAQREEIRLLVEQDTFDAAKAERLIAHQQDKERSAKLEMLKTQHEIYKVLTPEQRAKANVIRAEHKEKMKERHKDKAAKAPQAS